MKKSLQIHWFIGLASLLPAFLHANTYIFTSAGATGREGPTQAQVDANYTGTSLEGAVTVDDNNSKGIQEWTVPIDGNYSIEARGAQGGGDSGGLGAKIRGNFTLTKDSVIKIVVGQKGSIAVPKDGASASNLDYSASGGGGSYVIQSPYDTNSSILAIAGGGGASPGSSDYNQSGLDNGRVSTNGERGFGYNYYSEGGVAGNGGETNTSGAIRGSAGAGFFTDGPGVNNSSLTIIGASSFLNGSTGGYADLTTNSSILVGGADGGFGGGGGCLATGHRGSGGGGGYSGGGLGSVNSISQNSQGGGGGSYNSGTDQNNTAGANEGDGLVIITFLGSANQAPEITQGAGPLSKTIDEDTNATWTASELNATDPDTSASSLAWSLLSSPSNGNTSVDGNGSTPTSLSYQPNANYHGSDSFSVQVSDGDANDSITINLTINPVDDSTNITGETNASIAEDSSASGDLNATDADGLTDGSYFSISSAPANGSASIDPTDGNWTYSPNSNFFGSDSFIVSVTDDLNSSSTTTINLSVSSVDDATSITGDTNASIAEDSSASGDLNATDADGLTDGSYFSISSAPANGSASIDPTDGNWTYSPNPNFFGSDSFLVSITDDLNTSTTTTINLSISSVDDVTSISGDSNASLTEDSSASGDLNATDADGLTDGSYFSISSAPSNGSATIDPIDGNWTYSPDPNFFGSDSFVVSVTDDLNTSTTTTINLSVSSVDDSTSITGDTNASIAEDSSASGDLNATDADGLTDGSYFSISSAPSNGSATIDPIDGNWTYSPDPNFFGSDSFVVSVTDDQNTSSTTTISLSVSSVDDTTSITGDTNASIAEDSSASGDLNATDADGLNDGSYFSISSAAANGSASIDPIDGNWTYSPNLNFFGSDSFVVSVTDDQNTSSTTTISLSVSSVDDTTSITGDTNASIAEDSSASGDLNATDDDGLTDGSYFSISTAPSNGSAAIDPGDGNWTYSPNLNFFGSDSFVVSVTDDLNSSTTTNINLSVSSVDDTTILTGDTNASIAEDTYASGDLNATDADGLTDGSYFSISSVPSNGSASIDPLDGNWTYSPNPNYFGSDSFVVSVTDDLNFSTTTTINLYISSVDDTTSITGDTNASIPEDSSASGDLNATDADGLTDGSYFSISSAPSNGSASIDPSDGNWTYSPNPNFFGSDSFLVSVTDDLNTSFFTAINLSVTEVTEPDSDYTSPDDSTSSPDNQYTTPVDSSSSSDTGYQSPSVSYSSPDSNYSTPDDSIFSPDGTYSTPDDSLSSPNEVYASTSGETASPDTGYQSPAESFSSPDSNYSTPDDSVTSPDEVYTSSSGDTASPDTGYQSPTENYSSPDSNYSTPDDSVSSPDDAYSTSDDSVSSPDDQYASPEYHLPVVETGQPSIDATGFITLSGSVHSDGGSVLLEVGFLLSSTLDFNQSERVVTELDSGSGEFILQTSNQSALFVRAFASNAVGESLGQVVALDTPSSEPSAWADAETLTGGWLQSDWLGTFQPYGNGWIFHARLGWLYVPSSDDEGLWLWSSTEGWIWTQRGIAPHFFDHGSANWLYLLPAGEHEMTFYDYSIEDVR